MPANYRKGIACAGNWTVDLVKVIDCYPRENGLANILEEAMGGDGCAHNVTLSLARFDATLDLYAVGLIGNDPNGDFLLASALNSPISTPANSAAQILTALRTRTFTGSNARDNEPSFTIEGQIDCLGHKR